MELERVLFADRSSTTFDKSSTLKRLWLNLKVAIKYFWNIIKA